MFPQVEISETIRIWSRAATRALGNSDLDLTGGNMLEYLDEA